MRLGYRARTFLALFAVSAVAVVLAGTLLSFWLAGQTYQRIERSLVS